MSKRPSVWSNSLALSFGGVVLFVLLCLVVWFVPKIQVDSVPSPTVRIQTETAARDVLVKSIGGFLFFVTAFVGIRNLQVSEEKQVTERFSKAVEMLGHEGNVHIRLGGIYALERIAIDSKKDYYPVMQVLAAFVRTKAYAGSNQEPGEKLYLCEEFSSAKDNHEEEQERRFGSFDDSYEDIYRGEYEYYKGTVNMNYVPNHLADVQAAVSVIGRQNSGTYPLDLSKTLLEGLTFEGNYKNVSFYKAHLIACILGRPTENKLDKFQNNDFTEAVFERVKFRNSNLTEARFNKSVFITTDFANCNFTEANLAETQFSGETKIYKCTFPRSTWIRSSMGREVIVPSFKGRSGNNSICFEERSEVKETDITGANFEAAEIINTLFEGGKYQKAEFQKTKLSGVTFKNVDLSSSNFAGAEIGHEAKFYMGYRQLVSRRSHLKTYFDQVIFKNAGISKTELEAKATIIEADFTEL